MLLSALKASAEDGLEHSSVRATHSLTVMVFVHEGVPWIAGSYAQRHHKTVKRCRSNQKSANIGA